MAETEAQKKATKKWNDANKATEDDLLELRKMIDERFEELNGTKQTIRTTKRTTKKGITGQG